MSKYVQQNMTELERKKPNIIRAASFSIPHPIGS